MDVNNNKNTNWLREDLCNFKPASNLAFNEKIKALQKSGKIVYNLSFGQSPFPIPEEAQESLRENAGDNEYVAVKGLIETRKAICDYHMRVDNLENLDCNDVIVGPGSKILIYFLMRVIRGDVYIMAPTWTTYAPQAQLTNHKCHKIRTTLKENWKLTPKLLEEALKEKKDSDCVGVLIFCNPCNPTGTMYSESEIKALSEVMKKYKIIVLLDEIYGRLSYYEKHVSLRHYLPEQTVLSCGISKWASAGGWRFGYNIYPPQLRSLLDAVECLASNTYSCATVPVQRAVITLLSDSKNINDYVNHCSRVLRAVAEFTANRLASEGVGVSKARSGYYIAPDFEVIRQNLTNRGISTGQEMCDAILNECNVALMPCGPAFQHPEESLAVRLCYINFDGTKALKESIKLGLDCEISENFVKVHCATTYEAIENLSQWVKRQKTF